MTPTDWWCTRHGAPAYAGPGDTGGCHLNPDGPGCVVARWEYAAAHDMNPDRPIPYTLTDKAHQELHQ